jgi:hypothetical protein
MKEPMITYRGLLDMQVCVPKSWSDEQIIEFANVHNVCGTANGWQIRKQGDYKLQTSRERTQCEGKGRGGFVHVMLDA